MRTIREVRTLVTRVITDVYYVDGTEVERKVTEVTPGATHFLPLFLPPSPLPFLPLLSLLPPSPLPSPLPFLDSSPLGTDIVLLQFFLIFIFTFAFETVFST